MTITTTTTTPFITPLSHWFTAPAHQIIAFSQDTALNQQQLLARVSDWINQLKPLSGQRWAVFHHDADEFLAILLALWHLQRTACVPSDNQPGTLARMQQHVDGFIGDFDARVAPLRYRANTSATATDWQPLNPDFTALEIYTSGSTGEPLPIPRSLHQLDAEVSMHERLWPSHNKAPVLSSVTHHHAYGMIFRLFWPLCSQRPFAKNLCTYTEDIFEQGLALEHFTLISSPAHLTRLNPGLDWPQLHGRCLAVNSAAAPLSRQQSLAVGQILGTAIHEIYGCSEAGSLAWRCQQDSAEDACWQPLPGVQAQVSDQGTLAICTPGMTPNTFLSLADKIEFNAAGHFRLLGRADNIVKVEGKRVSLTAIERLLNGHDWVQMSKALVLTRKREEAAVVIELSQQGLDAFMQQGQKHLRATFRALLSPHFEAVVMPRRWRFVAAMPYNSQSKLPLEALRTLFDQNVNHWPLVTAQRVNDHHATLECLIPSELIYFDGHFTDNPVLPGIAQVHWAEAYGRNLLGTTGVFDRLEAVKFQNVITPSARVTLELSYNTDNQKLTFSYASERGVHASGRICFR